MTFGNFESERAGSAFAKYSLGFNHVRCLKHKKMFNLGVICDASPIRIEIYRAQSPQTSI